jgi:RNA polymerase sigma-70 factor (ECF subfamily)
MPDWQEILARDGKAAWQTAYRLLGNQADADDCFQEACLAAVRVSQRESVHNWRRLLQRLATVRALDSLRARNRAWRTKSGPCWDHLPDGAPSPLQIASEAELARELRQALSKIPPRQAEVFCLHCLEDWSYEEIAQQARMSLNTVGVDLHRARKRLRELLAGFREEVPLTLPKIDYSKTVQGTGKERKEHS